MKPILCFYMGYTPDFNGSNYHTKKVYGSEITSIKLAESLTNIYDVYMFVNGLDQDTEIIHNNVQYLNTHNLSKFKTIDIMIVVRYINYFIYFKSIAKKTFIWFHDVTAQPSFDGKLLINNGDHFLHNLRHSYNKIVILSHYHLQNNQSYINIPRDKFHMIPNIIDTKYYKPNIPIISNRFIYMSDVSRGLSILLDCLIYIQQFIPTISLTVFRSHEFTNTIHEKIKLLNNTVIYGKESQQVIADECLQAEYFFYPTNFHETFCNCAAEAQLYHTVCIYNPIGGLTTTIDDRGLVIPYNLEQPDYTQKTSELVIQLMNNPLQKKIYLEKGYEWAKNNLNIESIKDKWIKLFEQ